MSSNIKTLGRSPESNIVLTSSKVSSNHARITLEPDALKITDTNSANGVWYMGYRVPECKLRPGEKVMFADVEVTYEALRRHFPSPSPGPTPPLPTNYAAEFQKLKPLFEEYNNQKEALTTGKAREKMALQILFSSIPVGITLFMGDKLDGNTRILTMTSAPLIFMILQFMTDKKAADSEKLNELAGKYSRLLRCPNPKCHNDLSHRTWTYYSTGGACPFCRCSLHR